MTDSGHQPVEQSTGGKRTALIALIIVTGLLAAAVIHVARPGLLRDAQVALVAYWNSESLTQNMPVATETAVNFDTDGSKTASIEAAVKEKTFPAQALVVDDASPDVDEEMDSDAYIGFGAGIDVGANTEIDDRADDEIEAMVEPRPDSGLAHCRR